MPQTARQALIEMFFSKTPGTFEKHLPEATKAALHQARANSGPSLFDGFALLTSQMQSHGGTFQSFETGSVLFVAEDPQQQSKLEVRVERDELQGSDDKIELAFHAYKQGQLQTAGVDPRFTLVMKQEGGIWRLNDFIFALRVSLTDPALLKAMTTSVHPTQAVASTTVQTQNGFVHFDNSRSINEVSAAGAMRTLVKAENSYAAAYPNHGFTCTLNDLGGMGGGTAADEHHAMLVEPRLATGRKSGYAFKMTDCDGPPAAHFKMTAVPADASAGTRMYCTDESGVVRFTEDGTACGPSSKPLQ